MKRYSLRKRVLATGGGGFLGSHLCARLIELTGSRSKIIFQPLPSDDPVQRQPDIGPARKELAWKPTIELEDGLRRTIAYFAETGNSRPSSAL